MIDLDTKAEQAAAQTAMVENLPTKGDRGVMGTATAGLTIKQLWWAAKSGLSLKVYARQLLRAGDENAAIVKTWYANKDGALNAKRSDKSLARISAERSATKLARKPKKG